MTYLENVSTEDFRQDLAGVEGKDATQQMMAATNWKEEDGVRQKDIVHRYGYTQGGCLSGSRNSNGSVSNRSRTLSTTNLDPVVPPNSPIKSTSGSWIHSTNRRRKSVLTRSHGLFRSPANTSSKKLPRPVPQAQTMYKLLGGELSV